MEVEVISARGMSGEIHANYDQVFLLPPSIEDWVGQDHPARFLREFVEALDLRALGFRERPSEEGRPPYSNDLLLKAWLYGYLARIRSTRDLERACREHLSLIWLTGRHEMDHCTLWRFWHANRKALRAVFRSAEKTEAGEYRLPANLQVAEKLRAAIRESLQKMDAAERDHLHPQEAEARLMPCAGRTDPAYNAQAVADAQAGIIVAQTAVNAESDNAQLVPMLEETKANLGKVAAETIADGGYASGKQLEEAQTKEYEVLLSPGVETGGEKRGEYDSAKFEYDRAQDEVICPQGQRLKFEGVKKKSGKRPAVRSYHCQDHAQCPLRALCSRSRKGRRIEISPQRAAIMRQREKRRDAANLALLRQRKAIIEPVFATIKQAMGFRRWTVRGLENVRTQWALLCTAFNLKKLYQHWAAGVLAPA
jgi:transposase